MKVTYNWLKDFIRLKISPADLAERLTMAGLEVTSLEKCAGDDIFEIEVTSNRPDCLSVIGIAREIAALTGQKIKQVKSEKSKVKNKDLRQGAWDLKLEIENKKDCLFYNAKIIRSVRVGRSPDWLKNRLELIGCRSVNNVVDITNYILFTYGQPLHAFDLDRLTPDTVIVRRARPAERITILDGTQRILDAQVLLIADKAKAIAVAGIMGGKDTEVTETTQNILLEAAVFNPIVIRRGRQGLGVQSDSAYRFERGIDLGMLAFASSQAANLIQYLAAGTLVAEKSIASVRMPERKITLGLPAVKRILGEQIPAAKIKGILQSLGFKTQAKGKANLTVSVPSHRPDVLLEVDLIEEIARIFGYEKISPHLPAVSPQAISDKTGGLVSVTKNILAALGLNEVVTYSLTDKDQLKGLAGVPVSPIEILNPLSNEQEILRPTLIPGLARCIAYNLNQGQEYVNIFEVAKAFSQEPGRPLPKEELFLGIALCGTRSYAVLEQGLIKEKLGILHLKGILESFFARLGISDYDFRGSSVIEVCASGKKVGMLLGLLQEARENLGIKNKEVVVCELSLEKIFAFASLEKKFVGLPVYPGISRDISMLVKDDIPVSEILQAAKEKGGALLKEIKIIDYYRGKQVPVGLRSLTASCLYRSDERTLTEKEINPLHSALLQTIIERFGVQIR